jgi:hypothetical protein
MKTLFGNVIKIWKDPVWSKVIASAIIGLAIFAVGLVYRDPTPSQPAQPTSADPSPAVVTRPTSAPPFNGPRAQLSVSQLKNLTYEIDGEPVTLNEGKREFIADTSQPPAAQETTIAAYLTDYAFGDLDGDGNVDAVAVLQVSTGGTGIYYYVAPIFNDAGNAVVSSPALVLGDRLGIRNVSASPGKVDVEALVHGPDDALCCPSQMRRIVFRVEGRVLKCAAGSCAATN